MPYSTFYAAKEQLYGIEPLDFYFALEFSEQYNDELAKPWQELWFHVLLALSESARNGHTCLPINVIANHRFGFQSDQEVITHNGYIFPAEQELTAMLTLLPLSDNSAITFSQNSLYMRRNYLFEKELERALKIKKEYALSYTHSAIQLAINELFPEQSDDVDWQKLAVANSVNKGLSIIAGGPGTGKTYTVTKLLSALIMLNPSEIEIALVAPTGKAAQRLSESIVNAIQGFKGIIADDILSRIPTTALTLHRLLGVIPNQVDFRKGIDNPVHYNVVIVDEVSMVDLALMTRLFRALPATTQVIMLGDADQLPSVALGSVLADIAVKPHVGYSQQNRQYLAEISQLTKQQTTQLPIAKGKQTADHLSLLLKSRRFDGEGAVGQIALATIAGQAEKSWQYMQSNSAKGGDIYLLPERLNEWLPAYIDQYYLPIANAENVTSAFELLTEFRVLCATRVGPEGVNAINHAVISQLQGAGFIDRLYHGLPIMINENHYGLNLYNGDIGLIWRNEHGHLMACFETVDDQGQAIVKQIIPSRLPSFEPVYAMTIHKTQGSEFNHVAMVLPKRSETNMLSRELIYTGVTRAKQQLSICVCQNVWRSGLEAKVQRYSNLSI